MNKYLIVGDVAGRFKELLRLAERHPGRKIILVGDLNDRGPQSRQVIEWAMSNKNVVTLHSNHGDMFVDFVMGSRDPDYQMRYDYDDFLNNGGLATLASYDAELHNLSKIPMEHINWLETRPTIYDGEDFIVTHAPINPNLSDTTEMVWNRSKPVRLSKFQIFGHNSMWGLRRFDDFAICIDTSQEGKLTGMLWPERTFDFENYEVNK